MTTRAKPLSVHKKTNDVLKRVSLCQSAPPTQRPRSSSMPLRSMAIGCLSSTEPTRSSFADVATRVRALASALATRDFQCGGRAAIWAPNCAEWIIAALAIQYVGGTPCHRQHALQSKPRPVRSSVTVEAQWRLWSIIFLGTDYADELAAQNIAGLDHIVTLRAPGSASTDDIQTWISEGAVATPEICARRDALRRRVNEKYRF